MANFLVVTILNALAVPSKASVTIENFMKEKRVEDMQVKLSKILVIFVS